MSSAVPLAGASGNGRGAAPATAPRPPAGRNGGLRLPLRLAVPVALLLIGLTTAAWAAWAAVQAMNASTAALVAELVTSIGSNTAAAAAAGLRAGDQAAVRASIEQLQTLRGLQWSALVRLDGTVEQASRRRLVGAPLATAGEPVLSELYRAVRDGPTVRTRVSGQTFHYAQLVGGHDTAALPGDDPGHVLLLKYDFAPVHARNRAEAVNRTLLVAVPLLGLSLLSWAALRRSLLRPIGGLVEASARIAGGDLRSPVRDAGPAELRVLAQALDAMRTDLASARERADRAAALERETAGRLSAQEARMRLVLDNMSEGVIACDAAGRAVLANRSLREWHGVPAGADLDEGLGERHRLARADGHSELPLEESPLFRAVRGEPVRDAELAILREGHPARRVVVDADPLLDEEGRNQGAVALVRDVTERRRAQQRMRDALATLDAVEDAVFIFDPDTLRFSYVSEGAVTQLRYTREELMTMRPLDIESEFDEVGFRELLGRVPADGSKAHRFTTVHRRRGGVRVPVEINLQRVRIPGGKGRFIAIARDVTERLKTEKLVRRSLREKETLLKEIHHRVKNNLQVVSSLLDMQLSGASDPGVVAALRQSVGRVRSMAMIHEDLYQSPTLASVDFGRYAERLAHALFDSYGMSGRAELVVDAESVPLNVETAVPCGLILNEVISNAFKHALAGRSNGRLVVTLARAGSGRFRLTVRDDGPGFPPEARRGASGSLGMQLVRTLARQVRGRLDVEHDGGAVVSLEFGELAQGGRGGAKRARPA